MNVRKVPVTDLSLDPTNARAHNERNLQAIADSLAAFGQRRPLIVARGNHGEQVVIAGNGTLQAARSLGWSHVLVTDVPEDWDADKARAYAVADNRTAELAEWNGEVLQNTLMDLEAVGWEPAVLGFDDDLNLPPIPDATPTADNDVTCPACGHTWVPAK